MCACLSACIELRRQLPAVSSLLHGTLGIELKWSSGLRSKCFCLLSHLAAASCTVRVTSCGAAQVLQAGLSYWLCGLENLGICRCFDHVTLLMSFIHQFLL